ncbi:MAG: DNA methyltransferase [candidate division KSB1 bacterium]|nr:DNA methyltransferase [candidate division KSB1 bacterium]MDZ7365563.1 DNA methyltransferase [candidate division KSB1 bacterium]MDZ7403665.1 DNA methyltransferase [candidate division KSB1 bacterium]
MSSSQVDPKNQINDLDSRRWLQFQKSWFLFEAETVSEFIAFFTKKLSRDGRLSRVGIFSENVEIFQPAIEALGREAVVLSDSLPAANHPADKNSLKRNSPPENLDYVIVDLRKIFSDAENYRRQESRWLQRLSATVALMKPKSYLTIFLCNSETDAGYCPLAWEFGKRVGNFLTMKDEKIGCIIGKAKLPESNSANFKECQSGSEVVYCLNFRREPETALEPFHSDGHRAAPNAGYELNRTDRRAWFVLKPPPREKNVLLHPAKFPEPLIEQFIARFTQPGERVLDPMAGTGSALIAAVSYHREAYGVELNPAFCDIIRQRLALQTSEAIWKIACGDASLAETYHALPKTFHYIITSPPYWDMLRMKGAETQQKRQQAGLLQFYSDDARDVGNIADYENFLAALVKIYRDLGARLEPGRFMTIIVKNVKKKGKIFPLAWDLSLRLREDFFLHREQFWCQDDQRLAPFGYRYAWVSNTFHHYCLHFQKPING